MSAIRESLPIRLAESGRLPDPLIRAGIRQLLRRRLAEQRRRGDRGWTPPPAALAVRTDEANRQHYELPSALFELMLGPRLKYSACCWSDPDTTLSEAEQATLELTCERAGIEDGMRVLDLGCGWGSLSLWLAERYRNCRVIALSNSASQGDFIRGRAERSGLIAPRVLTADVNAFELSEPVDRVVSIEMFEHVRDHASLLARIATWLRPDGRLFVHHFCHRELSYPFEDDGAGDWMARHFFSGGVMPSLDLLERAGEAMSVERRWIVDGRDYRRTLLAWLERWDDGREAALPILAATYGADAAELWHARWRLFLLACAELFGYRDGNEWMVTHCLMAPVATA